MGTSLTGLTPATTYDALIKVGDNGPIDGTLKALSDGLGNDLPMEASTTGINFTGALQQSGVAVPTASQVAAKQDTLVSGTNIKTINGTSVLGSGNIVTPTTPPSGVSGAIQFSNGSAFASDASNLFWDDTNNRLGIGTNVPTVSIQSLGTIQGANLTATANANFGNVLYGPNFWSQANGDTYLGAQTPPSAKLQIKGNGSTSATTSLLVQNSGGTQGLKIDDALGFQLGLLGNNGAGCSVRTDGNNGGFFSGVNISINNGFAVLDSANTKVAWVPDAGGFRIPNSSRYPVTIGADTKAVASAQLEMVSTTQGFLPPRGTNTQMNAIASPATGLVFYDTTNNKLCVYNATSWIPLH